ncbi:MAG: DUF1788 domain-containing protein [Clostridiales bacterium]|jgi:hypothetical protein|nr:DUF1788 domain-containing protein [Clostridiales bacterium]
MLSIDERLELLKRRLLSEEFLKLRRNAGLNFFIFDYDPSDELAVRAFVSSLDISLGGSRMLRKFDLFGIMAKILREKNYMDKVLLKESQSGSESIINPIRRTLRLTLDSCLITNEIARAAAPDDIILITGVGKAWPVIRSHAILNSLYDRMPENPLILFFPGNYEDDLKLFNEVSDGNYYRAFKLIER